MDTKFWLGKAKVLSVGVVLLVAGCKTLEVNYCTNGTNTCNDGDMTDLGGIPVYFNVPVRYQYSAYSAPIGTVVLTCGKDVYEYNNVFIDQTIFTKKDKDSFDEYLKGENVVSAEKYSLIKNYEEIKGVPDTSRRYIINTARRFPGTATLKVEVNSDGTFKSTEASVTDTSANTAAGLASNLAAAYLAKAWVLTDYKIASTECFLKVTKTQTVVVTLRKKLGDAKFDSANPLTYVLRKSQDANNPSISNDKEVELVSTEISSSSSSEEKNPATSAPVASGSAPASDKS